MKERKTKPVPLVPYIKGGLKFELTDVSKGKGIWHTREENTGLFSVDQGWSQMETCSGCSSVNNPFHFQTLLNMQRQIGKDKYYYTGMSQTHM